MTLSIRPAKPDDLPLIAALIRELAEYEKLSDEVHFDEQALGDKLFGTRPYAEVLIGELGGEAQAFALFFHNFSTFEGPRGSISKISMSVRRLAAAVWERPCCGTWRHLRWSGIARGWNGGCSIGTSRQSASMKLSVRSRWTTGP